MKLWLWLYKMLVNYDCAFCEAYQCCLYIESLLNHSIVLCTHVQTCGCEWASESEAWSVVKVNYIDLIDQDNWEETIATTSIAGISSGEDI